jgi:hypothetical protein
VGSAVTGLVRAAWQGPMQANPIAQSHQHRVCAPPAGPVRVCILNSNDGEVAYAAGLVLTPSAQKHVLFNILLHVTRLRIGFCEQGHLRLPRNQRNLLTNSATVKASGEERAR